MRKLIGVKYTFLVIALSLGVIAWTYIVLRDTKHGNVHALVTTHPSAKFSDEYVSASGSLCGSVSIAGMQSTQFIATTNNAIYLKKYFRADGEAPMDTVISLTKLEREIFEKAERSSLPPLSSARLRELAEMELFSAKWREFCEPK